MTTMNWLKPHISFCWIKFSGIIARISSKDSVYEWSLSPSTEDAKQTAEAQLFK